MSATPEAIAAWEAERAALAGRVRAREVARRAPAAPYPAPTVACRLARDDELPSAARSLQRAVRRAGGTVQATYAQGYRPGRPPKLVDSIAVRCWAPDGRRLVACWVRVVGATAWSCELRMAWRPGVAPHSVSDAAMKVEVAGWL